jgi:hypothetical protein
VTIRAPSVCSLAAGIAACALIWPIAPSRVSAAESSEQLFLEAAKVFQHPRCTNCHAPGDAPRQSDDRRVHALGVKRGPNGRGMGGLNCAACHQEVNLAGIPGAPGWQAAPLAMAWGELSAGELCRAVTDKSKNGNRLPKGIVLHVRHDMLVHWAWEPGDKRTLPPLSHAQFVDVVTRWAESGGACPK